MYFIQIRYSVNVVTNNIELRIRSQVMYSRMYDRTVILITWNASISIHDIDCINSWYRLYRLIDINLCDDVLYPKPRRLYPACPPPKIDIVILNQKFQIVKIGRPWHCRNRNQKPNPPPKKRQHHPSIRHPLSLQRPLITAVEMTTRKRPSTSRRSPAMQSEPRDVKRS